MDIPGAGDLDHDNHACLYDIVTRTRFAWMSNR